MDPRTKLLHRLFLDAVLPVTLAALALVLALTAQVANVQGERLDAQLAWRIEQLAGTIAAGIDAPQPLLDAALREGGLRHVELQHPDGRRWSSGQPVADQQSGNYRRALPAIGGGHPALTMQADLQPLRRAQTMTWLLGALCAAGVLLLAWMARWTLHRQVTQPLQKVQGMLDACLDGLPLPASSAGLPEAFAHIEQALPVLAGRREQTSLALDTQDARQNQAATHSKARFIALVNHHFRQPLQALQLFTANLHPSADIDQQALLTHMRASIASMTRLLDALLEMSRLDAGVVTVKPVEFSVTDLFLHDRQWLNEEASRRGATVIWHDSHHHLQGDAELAASLLLQLASNAIANAPLGRVLIAARRRGRAIRIEVRDNGPGIAADQQQHIFEEFVQLPAAEALRRDGYGLGLAIGDRLARLLGTRIGLRSEPGRGSTFWFDLPEAPVAERSQAPRGRKPTPIWRRAS
ncbi:Signal transduction histidine kinase [Dyella sp. OK004]|uniref:sensor histidine kinase n=1 Tax=Dyella sp. OK004 TaxID=1855292 RepID=UPI0008E59C17|nr:HAMP domain-containing sensor histidine kinase [Dyella sp. OK004]SFR88994.1 Signal transduction histidine kinase [Dyella sp. OK004]